MPTSLRQIIENYAAGAPLSEAGSPPAPWYTDARILEAERRTVFARSWQMAGRADQLRGPGQYIARDLAGEPVLIIIGNDNVLRGFFNVCRHKGAAVITKPEGQAQILRCPYHGWTYTLEGDLKVTPDFGSVRNFDPSQNALIPIEVDPWEKWIFVKLEQDGPSLKDFLGPDLIGRVQTLQLQNLHWMEQRRYSLDCNWKVFIDNYLDG